MFTRRRLLSTLKATFAPSATDSIATAAISIHLPSSNTNSHFHTVWLRDHCTCSVCVHSHTLQRLSNTAHTLTHSSIRHTVLHTNRLVITWVDDHVSTFTYDWLERHSYHPKIPSKTTNTPSILSRAKILWDAQNTLPIALEYEEVMNTTSGVLKWLENILLHGIGFVKNVPVSIEKTKLLSERLGLIRPTLYGTFWDFTSNLAKKDTAYTSLALPTHTDTTYFTDPIGVQLFHLLEHRGTGGEQVYVDGFKCAEILRQTSPASYATLSSVATHGLVDNHSTILAYPILTTSPVLPYPLVQVRYNNSDRAPLSLTYPQTGQFYGALGHWMRIIGEQEVEVQLTPGLVVAMDNHRVLHGRNAFCGYRRMAGCYFGMDDIRARVRGIEQGMRI